jgi:hypothetical protein
VRHSWDDGGGGGWDLAGSVSSLQMLTIVASIYKIGSEGDYHEQHHHHQQQQGTKKKVLYKVKKLVRNLVIEHSYSSLLSLFPFCMRVRQVLGLFIGF